MICRHIYIYRDHKDDKITSIILLENDMHHSDLTASLLSAQIGDREAIRDCLARYCRGIDRGDAAMLSSAYWEDAVDDHGAIKGTAAEFIEKATKPRPDSMGMHHMMGQVMMEIDGDSATVESYFNATHRLLRADGTAYDLIVIGRYLDRMERRGDEWRIADRIAIRDWFREYDDSADWSQVPHANRGGHMPSDFSYTRFSTR
ncbi:MAG: nuclear transport factor 2 family protein [Sphingobium sp.]